MDLCQQLAILLAKSSNEVLQAKFLHLRGIIYRDREDLENATADLEKALGLYGDLQDEVHIANCMVDLGVVYYQQNQTAKAVENFKRALASFEARGDLYAVAITRFNIGDILLQEEQYGLAIEQMKAALQTARKIKLTSLELTTGLHAVEIQIALSRLDEAEEELSTLKPLLAKGSSSCLRGQELALTAGIHWKRKQIQQAAECFHRAFEFFEGAECQEQRGRAYITFAGFMKEQGDLERAREALLRGKNIFAGLNHQLGLQMVERALLNI
jgi:tetratricopeptide (TPR) repeat protein